MAKNRDEFKPKRSSFIKMESLSSELEKTPRKFYDLL